MRPQIPVIGGAAGRQEGRTENMPNPAKSFFGGVHPGGRKSATDASPIEILPAPERLTLPMSMHMGEACAPLVKPGDRVLLGQRIGEACGELSAYVHSPVSGVVAAVEPRLHPDGTRVLSAVIDNDFQDTPSGEMHPCRAPEQLSGEEFTELVRNAGIVGMGGGAFPTHVKIASSLGRTSTVILNGAECEPYITSDHRLLLERPEEVLGGARLLRVLFGVPAVTIGIGADKHDAIELLRSKLPIRHSEVTIVTLHTRYPQGAERQIVQSITGREVPPGQAPSSVGCVVFNVGTAAAVCRAVTSGLPLIRRIVTVSGSGIKNPKVLDVPLGTPFSALIEAAGGFVKTPRKILMGGPMMGLVQSDLSAPVVKGTNALLALTEAEIRTPAEPVCIRCGRCVEVCPMRLAPLYLYAYEKKNDPAQLQRLNIADCTECGCCSYICPGRLPLVPSIRTGKRKLAEAFSAGKEGNGTYGN